MSAISFDECDESIPQMLDTFYIIDSCKQASRFVGKKPLSLLEVRTKLSTLIRKLNFLFISLNL